MRDFIFLILTGTKGMKSSNRAVKGFSGLWLLITPISLVLRKKTLATIKNLQGYLMNIAAYFNDAKKLYTIAHNNPALANNLSLLPVLRSLAFPNSQYSAEFNELIALLDTNTFNGDPSIFSINGRTMRAHALLMKDSVKRDCIDIINAIGEIDSYVAVAKKIQLTQHAQARYCLVEFDTKSSDPYLKAENLWNPFVNEKNAVTNTIEMGGANPRNIVLDGPHTGGKSTIARAVLLNAILAQTFGIAAASTMTLTPFNNIDCYLNITDDTAGGISGLKAETNRAYEITEKLRQTNGFSLILLDEIFTKTSPDQAEELAIELLSTLSKLPHCIFINVAHFEGIIEHAQQLISCRNCHIEAITDDQGTVLKYTYKLAEGRSFIKNAKQIARETGLPTHLL